MAKKKIEDNKKRKNNTKNSKKKINKSKITGLILLVLIVSFLVYATYEIIKLVAVPTNTFIIENGSISSEESITGYVIREEKTAKGANYKNGMVPIKTEGEKVAKGENIFRYYGTNEEDIKQKITEINENIQKAISGQTQFLTSDINAIDNQITSKIEGINGENEIQKIREHKKDIDTYITKKSKIAGELSQAGSYINGLIQEKNKYDEELKKNSEYVVAPMSGVVSYRIDNLEEILTPNSFEKLDKKFLEDLGLKTGQIVSSNSEMGKVINNYECYIATIMESKEARESQVGDKVTLRLSTQDSIKATIEYKTEKDNYVLLILKINNCVEKLIDYRKISIDVIWWEYEGLKVPKSAIIYDNGLSYIVRNRGGYLSKILVKICKEGENYCIISNYDSKELKELGFTTDEINNMRQVTIYDEIVLNPDLKNIE